jgi:hypothetical protein
MNDYDLQKTILDRMRERGRTPAYMAKFTNNSAFLSIDKEGTTLHFSNNQLVQTILGLGLFDMRVDHCKSVEQKLIAKTRALENLNRDELTDFFKPVPSMPQGNGYFWNACDNDE